jgi:hypothetical protein
MFARNSSSCAVERQIRYNLEFGFAVSSVSFMLELPALHIEPWQPALAAVPGRACWHRTILDQQGGRAVGVVLWQQSVSWKWLRFLWVPFFAVHESDDEPLLFTARRVWSPRPSWEVNDAEQHCVGGLRPPWVVDAEGRTIARIERAAGATGTIFRGPGGEELASLQGNEERLLRFGCGVAAEPFVKMLLLAAALTGK